MGCNKHPALAKGAVALVAAFLASTAALGWFPSSCFTAIKLSRHTGMDCRYPDHREVNLVCHPWHLCSGNPCRNDVVFLNLMAVTLLLGNPCPCKLLLVR